MATCLAQPPDDERLAAAKARPRALAASVDLAMANVNACRAIANDRSPIVVDRMLSEFLIVQTAISR